MTVTASEKLTINQPVKLMSCIAASKRNGATIASAKWADNLLSDTISQIFPFFLPLLFFFSFPVIGRVGPSFRVVAGPITAAIATTPTAVTTTAAGGADRAYSAVCRALVAANWVSVRAAICAAAADAAAADADAAAACGPKLVVICSTASGLASPI